MVFQNHSLLPWLTCFENVLPGGRARVRGHRKQGAAQGARTDAALALVGLTPAAQKRPGEISGGMKQRVGIARALSMEPKVLLMDEPFGALDALTRAKLQDELLAIVQKTHSTVVMVTHDVDEAVLLSRPHRDADQRPGRHHRRGPGGRTCRARATASNWPRTRPTCTARKAVIDFLYTRQAHVEKVAA